MDDARQKIRQLIEKFERERTAGTVFEYNESETKAGFIEPLLQALGWNTQDRNEVGFETKVSGGRVDYSLKLYGTPRIYVEAKPLKADLAKPDIVTQAVTYGYNTKAVKWVLLTDFQELRLFDVTLKPSSRNLERGLRLQLRYTDYLDRFDQLWLLSKPSVERGELDRVLLTKKAERDRLPVDQAILEDLKRWQEILAKDLYKRSNSSLDAERLREATQRILDRIIFIRSCEDRKLTHVESLRDLVLQRREEIGADFGLVLKGLFRRYDRDFNSDLFAPHFSEDLAVDFTVLKAIILETYEPYLFDVIGVHLLGSIYEQYLGYTINLTGKRVKYELKPEVRKAGGVYYTPEYIVDYIVKNTLGRVLQERGKNPTSRRKTLPFRVLDMACGSGSFLIRAYDELSRHYETLKAEALKRRAETLKKARLDQFAFPLSQEEEEVSARLTLMEKRQMVLDHLFGVDIDPQACEVARLSLMLKMLEDEYGIVPGRAVLPALDHNIQCGNSLISGDVLNLQSFFKEDWIKTKPFDWEVHFRTIMEEGGFDVIIGNPPYVRIQTLPRDQVAFFNQHYASATGNYDIYVLFVEQALKLLKPGGILGFILPHKFFQAAYGKGLRKLIADQKCLLEIVNFRDNQIFEGSSTYTCLLFLQKGLAKKAFKYAEVLRLTDPAKQLQIVGDHEEYADQETRIGKVLLTGVTEEPWHFRLGQPADLLERLREKGKPLEEVTERIFQGLKTSADDVYILDLIERRKKIVKAYSKALEEEVELESEIAKPLIKGGQMRRYLIEEPKKVIIFPYRGMELIPKKEFQDRYPKCWEYLLANKRDLENREGGKMKGEGWYRYGRNQALDVIHLPKIITPDFALSASYCYDAEGTYYFTGGAAGGYGIIPKEQVNPKYLLGLLNSRLLDWFLHQISTTFRGGYFSYEARFIKHLPIRLIDFSNPAEKKLHDDLVALVDVMLALHRRLQQAVGAEQEQLHRQIEKTDREIDKLVYQLYGTTEKEQMFVETKH